MDNNKPMITSRSNYGECEIPYLSRTRTKVAKKSPDENGIQEEKRNSHKVQGSIFLNHFEKKQQQKRRGSLES